MAALAVQQIVRAGLTATLAAAAAAGDTFLNGGRTFLRVKNGHAAASRTVTITATLPAGAIPPGAALANLAVVVPALTEKFIGPLDPTGFNDATGSVAVTYSDAAADLTVAAVAL